MSLADLSEPERGIVKDCLRAAVEGPFFPESEFHTIFGIERDEVKSVLESWPDLDESNESVRCAINNSMLNLLGYPSHDKAQEWPKFISVTRAELWGILQRWKGAEVRDYKARDYFDGLL